MRLIDADELEKVMTEDWFLEILATQDSKSAIKKDILNRIDSVPIAYDVEAVVAKLEKEYDLADKEKARCMEENLLQYDEAKGYARGIDTAISIVRGKE